MSRVVDFACGILAALTAVLVVQGLRWVAENPLTAARGALLAAWVVLMAFWLVMPHGDGQGPSQRM